ncbi:MAG: fructosamine kinase family protein [Leptolyngbyaceae cyanobacterium bins.59]|nr:fructosamine kinase family protein [Leptolyngbyaceae cyanobacterium bins.59]
MWKQIATHISEVTDHAFGDPTPRSVGGGCINQGYALSDGDRTYFVKVNRAVDLGMFEAEALGLQQMHATQTIRVPRPLCSGTAGDSAYLVLEWLNLGRGTGQSWREMGCHLARMHRATSKQGFGWDRANTIGSTPQPNPWTMDWTQFWVEHRIGYQLNLARRRGGYFTKQEQLLAVIPEILADHQPQPSLVHGDLWSGNAAILATGEPVIFDPATYYGDREVDLAMTELFGRFPTEFYQGYNEVFPLESGYARRKILYNLYHILNHFNLFGGGYSSQASSMIEMLLG